ncbi:MAG: hypothetical protein KDK41_12405 [Leptospiraceae bacterium]|nr:hypothetical protein [Leptospiraceae bacterium]MCB1201440.1 hypothetical protein [Leptospiraceae bacterium]
MQKYTVALLAAAVISVSMVACKSGGSTTQLEDGKTFITEGWLDDNTLQVKALGAPASDAKGFVKRRTQAQSAALIMAQKRFVEVCVGGELKGAAGALDGESTGVAVSSEFEGFIRGGQIINTTYDADDNAEVLFRVSGNNLKRRCSAAAEKIQ